MLDRRGRAAIVDQPEGGIDDDVGASGTAPAGQPELRGEATVIQMIGDLTVAIFNRDVVHDRQAIAEPGGVTFCDLRMVPAGPVGRFLVTQMAAVAEL
jgi:hypothetical protein